VLSVTAAVTPVPPANDKASVNRSNVSFPVEPLITKSVAIPVKPLPSPTNEPLNEPLPIISEVEPKVVPSNWVELEIKVGLSKRVSKLTSADNTAKVALSMNWMWPVSDFLCNKVPPKSIVEPLRYKSLHLLVEEPKS